MGITEAGRKKLEVENLHPFEQKALGFVQRGRKAQEGVDEIMSDANRNLDLAMLEGVRRRLTELDIQRSENLREIADLTSKLGLTESERRNGV